MYRMSVRKAYQYAGDAYINVMDHMRHANRYYYGYEHGPERQNLSELAGSRAEKACERLVMWRDNGYFAHLPRIYLFMFITLFGGHGFNYRNPYRTPDPEVAQMIIYLIAHVTKQSPLCVIGKLGVTGCIHSWLASREFRGLCAEYDRDDYNIMGFDQHITDVLQGERDIREHWNVPEFLQGGPPPASRFPQIIAVKDGHSFFMSGDRAVIYTVPDLVLNPGRVPPGPPEPEPDDDTVDEVPDPEDIDRMMDILFYEEANGP
jgi:hypothetical protein